MTNPSNLTERNLELSAEFSRFVFEHPEIEEKISVESEIILLPEFDPELKDHNLQIDSAGDTTGNPTGYLLFNYFMFNC